MNPPVRPAFERGVRLRPADDGGAMLLVPEGAVTLNASAARSIHGYFCTIAATRAAMTGGPKSSVSDDATASSQGRRRAKST